MSFGTLRILFPALAVLAQVYLFLRIRHAIRSSRRLKRNGWIATLLLAIAIGLLFAANWRILLGPITWVDPPLSAQVLFFYGPAVWGFGSIFSALFLFLARVMGWLARLVICGSRKVAGRSSDQVNVGRRRFLQAGVAGIGVAPFLISGYGAAYEGHECRIEEVTLPLGLPLRAVQLSDIHAGIFMTPGNIRSFVDQAIALKPDILLLTGDYISNSTVFFPSFVSEVARIKPRYGTFATLGNHENWYGEPSYFDQGFRQQGIHFLQNAHRLIRTEEGIFAIAGIDDLFSGEPDMEAALSGLEPGTPTILLSHRPEIFPQAAALRIQVILSGHYHGGQIKLSFWGTDISLAHLRSPYPEGLYRIDASHLYVSRGIGTTFTPIRLNAPPEVTLFHLT